jgi:hypothetical protein
MIRLAILILGVGSAASGAAQQQPPPEAGERFRAGVAALRAEDYAAAAEAFQRSWELDPRAATMCNLALTFDRWPGHAELAVQAYDRCAQDDASGRFRDHAIERSRVLRDELSRGGAVPPDRPPPDRPGGAPDPFVGQASPPPGAGAPPPGNAWAITAEQAAAEPERSHGLLYGGLVAAGLGAIAFGIGAALILDAAADEAYLAREYDDGRIPIPRDSAHADLLSSAESQASTGVILYVVSGALAALGATLIIIDLTMPGDAEHSPYSAHLELAPTESGAVVGGRFRF